MDIFDVLALIGGLSLFLFGMNTMGSALERRAGSSLRTLLRKLTTNPIAGFLTGLGVTAVIQSSSATTVMVVGFVNSGLMTLTEAINVIMGANVGTTVTSWVLSLSGIESGNFFVQMLKPTSFTPILALIGIIFFMFFKDDKKKDTGTILLGFATLMFGMDAMSDAVSGLKNVPEFQQLFIMFQNPVLGVLAGAVLTAVIQSSSASVGILQALSSTGQVTYAAAIPIIMGQNIGTCITAMLSSVGTNKNARRASMVHLMFNLFGTLAGLILFIAADLIFHPAIFAEGTTGFGIAICHTIFNILCTALLLPQGKNLEKLVCKLIPDDKLPEQVSELDERLLATPPLALERCRMLTADMAACAKEAVTLGLGSLKHFDPADAERVRELEKKTDHYEDILGTYLVKLSTQGVSKEASAEAAGLLKLINDFERIGDHALNFVESAEEIQEKQLRFTDEATAELEVISAAVLEVVSMATGAFLDADLNAATCVEPLEEVIDGLKEQLRTAHIHRLQQGKCSIENGFVWADLLNGLERTSDHCSNVAVCVIDMAYHNMNMHESLRNLRENGTDFEVRYAAYLEKYAIAE